MQLGMVGLGRLGSNLVRRPMHSGHECVAFDVNPESVTALESGDATGARSVDELLEKLSAPRAAWVMVPAGEISGQPVTVLATRMQAGDVIIDGGNSYYRNDIRRVGSRDLDHFANQALSAMRKRFGGHAERPAG